MREREGREREWAREREGPEREWARERVGEREREVQDPTHSVTLLTCCAVIG